MRETQRAELFLQEVAELIAAPLESSLEGARRGGDVFHRAMRHTLLAPAKRFRPALALAAARAVGGDAGRTVPFMVALELLHTYSLIHDDLPCMDDDDLRRGQPTCHRVFGEGMAVLAGDALQALAFEILTRAALEAPDGGARELRALAEITGAAGPGGMAAGQALDLQAEGKKMMSAGEVEEIHRLKTGALLRAAVLGGAHLGGAGEEDLACLGAYGGALGLAFQVVDDLLNENGDARVIGKAVGSDRRREKPTLPVVMGMEPARLRARELLEECLRSIRPLGERGSLLQVLAQYAVGRDR